MEENTALLRALLTAQTVLVAELIFNRAQNASLPINVKIESGPDFERYENVNTNRPLTWEQALAQAADQIAASQPKVLRLLADRGLSVS